MFELDELTSGLIKSILRGKVSISIEIAKYFDDITHLKKILMELCFDCIPNTFLIFELNSLSEKSHLINYIPTLCKHPKLPYIRYILRVVCEQDPDFEPLSWDDTISQALSKCWTRICIKDYDSIYQRFEDVLPKNHKSYNIIYIVLYGIAAKYFPDFSTNSFERCNIEMYYSEHTPKKISKELLMDIYKHNLKKLPEYVYDMTVKNSGPSQKSYAYYISNLVINNLYDISSEYIDTIREGRDRLIHSGNNLHKFIRPLVQSKEIPSARLLMYKKSTKTYISSVMFMDIINTLDDNEVPHYNYLLVGPYTETAPMRKLLIAQYIKNLINIPNYIKYVPARYHNNMYLLGTNPWKLSKEFINGCESSVELAKNNNKYISNQTLKKYEDKLSPGRDRFFNKEVYNIPEYISTLHEYRHDYVQYLSDSEFLELCKNIFAQQCLGVYNAWCSNIILSRPPAMESIKMKFPTINYNEPIKFYLILDEASFKGRLSDYLLSPPCDELMHIEYTKKLKKVFPELLKYFDSIYDNIVKDEVIEINEKSYILKQIIILRKITNWMFN